MGRTSIGQNVVCAYFRSEDSFFGKNDFPFSSYFVELHMVWLPHFKVNLIPLGQQHTDIPPNNHFPWWSSIRDHSHFVVSFGPLVTGRFRFRGPTNRRMNKRAAAVRESRGGICTAARPPDELIWRWCFFFIRTSFCGRRIPRIANVVMDAKDVRAGGDARDDCAEMTTLPPRSGVSH